MTHSSILAWRVPGESRGQRSLVGYSPQGCNESDNDGSDLTRMHRKVG